MLHWVWLAEPHITFPAWADNHGILTALGHLQVQIVLLMRVAAGCEAPHMTCVRHCCGAVHHPSARRWGLNVSPISLGLTFGANGNLVLSMPDCECVKSRFAELPTNFITIQPESIVYTQ